MEEDDLLRRETMGMVFQDNSFFSGQTVYKTPPIVWTTAAGPKRIERAVVEV